MENDTALERYCELVNVAHGIACKLALYLEDNGEVSPDDVNWAHVGSMYHIVELLTELQTFANSGRG